MALSLAELVAISGEEKEEGPKLATLHNKIIADYVSILGTISSLVDDKFNFIDHLRTIVLNKTNNVIATADDSA